MKTYYYVPDNGNSKQFLSKENAELHAEACISTVEEKEVNNKDFKNLLKEVNFFDDAKILETPKQEVKEEQNELIQKLEALQKENEQLKQQTSLSYEDAAEMYRKKAGILKDIQVFENVLNNISNIIEAIDSEEDLTSATYNVTLKNNNSYSNAPTVLSISNVIFINSFLEFATNKIESKVSELKEEIQAI